MNRILPAAVLAVAAFAPPLMAAPMVPGIQGTVFHDADNSGGMTSGEGISGVSVRLYQDLNGNGSFDLDDPMSGDLMTDANGHYAFPNLDPNYSYFAVRPSQNLGSMMLGEEVSPLLSPGTPDMIIDSFDNSQIVKADPYTPISTSTYKDLTSDVLGNERDMYVRLLEGIGKVQLQTNSHGVAVVRYDNTFGVRGNGIITWDGSDMSANPVPSLGLGDVDLTHDGANTGIFVRLGIDSTGAGEQIKLRIFDDDASIYSEGTIDFPVTDGTATGSYFLPFTELAGSVSPSRVNAIQLLFGDNSPSIDAQLDVIGVLGPLTADFEVVPEPGSGLLALLGLAAFAFLRRR